VAAFAGRIELGAEPLDRRTVPPVAQRAFDRGLVRQPLHRAFGIDLGERRRHGGDVAAVSVDEEEAREAVPRQGQYVVAHDRDESRGLQRDRAGEIEMMLRHADRDRRGDQRADLLATPRPIISAVSASVPISPVGPCCS